MGPAGGPFRVPGFLRLASVYTLNDLGDQIGLVAAAVLVLDKTGSPLATAALFIVGQSLPGLAAPPIAAFGDRFRPRIVLPILYLLEAAAFAGLAILASNFALGAVLAIVLVDGILAITARSIVRATIALLLRPAGLVREGNNATNVAFSVSNTIGPVTGGVIVAAGGTAVGLWIDAALFVLMALVLVFPGHWPPHEHEHEEGWRARLRDGIRYARSTPGVGSLIAAESGSLIALTLVLPVTVVLAKQTLHAGPSGYGLIQSSWGAGIVIGSLLLLRGGSLRAIIGTGLLAIGVAYLATAGAPNLALVCVASVVGGLGNGVESVSVLTAVQLLVDDAFMVRVSTLIQSAAAVALGLGFALGGVVADAFSPRAAYALAGVGVLLFIPIMVRSVRAES